jgi:hypothetical protein
MDLSFSARLDFEKKMATSALTGQSPLRVEKGTKMTASLTQTSTRIDRIKEYFRRADAGDFAAELFTENFQFYIPKYGLGHGASEFFEMASGMQKNRIRSISHHIDNLIFIEQGNQVAVEGTTEGTGVDGVEWHGGQTPGGRFCSVFAFNADSLIERMHVYLDPDFTSRDKAAFFWPDRSPQQW